MSLGIQFICDLITNLELVRVFVSLWQSTCDFRSYKLGDCSHDSNKDALEDDVAMEIELQISRSQTFLLL